MKPYFPLLFIAAVAVMARADVFAQSAAESIRVKPLDSGVNASFRGLAVRDEREAWISGTNGTVIRTLDAGASWNKLVIPGTHQLDFRDVELLPNDTVLLMSIGPGNASRLLRSSDGGSQWDTVLTNKDPDGFFDGIAFSANGRDGVLFGDPIDGFLDLYGTQDGGKTWQRFPIRRRPKLNAGEYAFAASGSSINLIGNKILIATGGSTARAIFTNDQGRNWKSVTTGIRSGNESSGIFSVDFIDGETAVVVGGDYLKPDEDRNNVAQSTDGGLTWSVMKSVRMPHKACVRSLGKGRLLACGRTGVAFSADAGRTWETVTKDGYYTLAFDQKSNTGFLAGKEGRVARFEFRSQPSE